MDKQYIEENAIDTKYLRNQLTPEETEEFEVYLMENPEMVERLELDSVLVTEFAAVQSKIPKGLKGNLFTSWSLARVALSGLASLVFGALVMSVLLTNIGRPGVAQIAYLSGTRGSEEHHIEKEFTFSKKSFSFFSSDQVVIVFELGRELSGKYEIDILRNAGTEFDSYRSIRTLRPVSTNMAGELVISFPVNELGKGRFKVIVRDKQSERFHEFSFAINIQSPV